MPSETPLSTNRHIIKIRMYRSYTNTVFRIIIHRIYIMKFLDAQVDTRIFLLGIPSNCEIRVLNEVFNFTIGESDGSQDAIPCRSRFKTFFIDFIRTCIIWILPIEQDTIYLPRLIASECHRHVSPHMGNVKCTSVISICTCIGRFGKCHRSRWQILRILHHLTCKFDWCEIGIVNSFV